MTKLTRNDWIEIGLKSLRDHGFTSLKADKLAKQNNVSRGSFYGYFQSIEAFHAAIFEGWLAQSEAIASELATQPNPEDKLIYLIDAAAKSDLPLERAIRSWAHLDANITERVQEIDKFRIGILVDVLSLLLEDKQTARARAKLLYASALGVAFLPKEYSGMNATDLSELKTLFGR
ncbi:MAG: TetR/AcrR family transcriptional regulator [Pseudomonadota bacterium]